MTTPEQVVEALLSNPLRNTMVCLVSFDVARLAALAKGAHHLPQQNQLRLAPYVGRCLA